MNLKIPDDWRGLHLDRLVHNLSVIFFYFNFWRGSDLGVGFPLNPWRCVDGIEEFSQNGPGIDKHLDKPQDAITQGRHYQSVPSKYTFRLKLANGLKNSINHRFSLSIGDKSKEINPRKTLPIRAVKIYLLTKIGECSEK